MWNLPLFTLLTVERFHQLKLGYFERMTQRSTGRTVLITGASRGIGRQTALRFAASGNNLILAARGIDGLRSVQRECLQAGAAGVLIRPIDISDTSSVSTLFDEAVARFGRIDVVVQNASIAAFGGFNSIPADVFDAVVRINVIGAAAVCREALLHFRDNDQGDLVVIGSLLGHVAVPFMTPYVMSKFSVTALVRILRQETRHHKYITVHGIYPGAVDTPVNPLSASFAGRLTRLLLVNDPPEKIASAIVDTVGRRGSEKQVGLANRPLMVVYRLLPRVFDTVANPLLSALGFATESSRSVPGAVESRTAV